MIRLIDRIRAQRRSLAAIEASFVDPGLWEAHEARIRESIDRATVIVADNIDEFAWSRWPPTNDKGTYFWHSHTAGDQRRVVEATYRINLKGQPC